MSNPYLTPVTLRAEHVTLTPLAIEHAADLFAALNNDEELWRYIPVPQPRTLAEMHDWVQTALDEQARGVRIPSPSSTT